VISSKLVVNPAPQFHNQFILNPREITKHYSSLLRNYSSLCAPSFGS
jgi:hypothetical protein